MYSILIKNGDKNYFYHANSDGTIFAGDAEAAKSKVKELLETYPISKISVVHNVTLTADFSIEDIA